MSTKRSVQLVLVALLCVAAARIGHEIVRDPAKQWDFFTYYHAAKAYALGLDPYDIENVSKVAGARVALPFVYPPPALLFFRPFALFEYATALQIYFWSKVAVLVALLVAWIRGWARPQHPFAFVLFALLAFNSAVYMDLRSGNPALFEQGLLWIAFFGYVRERYAQFCLGVVAAASVKLVPLALIGLLLFAPAKRKLAYVVASCAALPAVAGVWSLLDPALMRSFVRNLTEQNTGLVMDELGSTNPCSYGALRHLLSYLEQRWPGGIPTWSATVAYLAIVVLVGTFTASALRRQREHGAEAMRYQVGLACAAYALMLPRFKDYTYMLLIAPAFWILQRQPANRLFAMALALFVLSARTPLPRLQALIEHAWDYFPLALAWLTWLLYLRSRPSPRHPGETEPAVPRAAVRAAFELGGETAHADSGAGKIHWWTPRT